MKLFSLLVIGMSLLAPAAWSQSIQPPTFYTSPEAALQLYRSELTRLRLEYTNHRDLPNLGFFLFGMGNRTKYLYRHGRLMDALTGHIEEQWNVESEVIVPSEYLVHLKLTNGTYVQIREDETGVWVLQQAPGSRQKTTRTAKARRIPDTKNALKLPRFTDNTYGLILRTLHHEILINIVNASDGIWRPVPNLFVYQKPRYRDAAMMAMALQKTENLELLRPWIMSLRSPFDRADRGVADVDNIGQVLYLVSLVSDPSHPVIRTALDSISRFQYENFIRGKTDHGQHPVYQTKWLKYGLKSLGLPDPYVIPNQPDSYASLFWCDFTNEPVSSVDMLKKEVVTNYPYLGWAQNHFFARSGKSEKSGMLGTIDYPLSWEQKASSAHYPGLTVLDKDLVKQKLTFPHGWHAAELFLLLMANPKK